MRSRYDVMKRNINTKDSDGNFYYDALSFPLDKFRVTIPALEYNLSETDISRIDILMFRAYSLSEYDDIVMLLNNIGILDDVESGEEFYLPDRVDIENFLIRNRQG